MAEEVFHLRMSGRIEDQPVGATGNSEIDLSQLHSLMRRTPAERMALHDRALSQALTLRRAMREQHA